MMLRALVAHTVASVRAEGELDVQRDTQDFRSSVKQGDCIADSHLRVEPGDGAGSESDVKVGDGAFWHKVIEEGWRDDGSLRKPRPHMGGRRVVLLVKARGLLATGVCHKPCHQIVSESGAVDQNQLTLNASKTTTTLFTPDPAEYNTTLTLQINNTTLPTNKEPKILGLTLDPKLTYSKHIQNTTQKAKHTIHIMKALTTTHWGKSKEALDITYKTITKPILENASTIWSPIISNTNKLQTIQNSALRTITGCTLETITHHLHTETKILPIDIHMKLHGSQVRLPLRLERESLDERVECVRSMSVDSASLVGAAGGTLV